MRFSAVALVLGYSSLALAQTQLLPECAQKCVGSDFGGCGTLDVKCICSNTELLTNLACCVSTGCDQADQETVIKFANSICTPQGITNLPQSATCAPGASSGAASGTASASGSASVTATSGAASASASATHSAASSAASSASSRASSAASSAASAAATGAAPVCKGNTMGMGFGMVLAGLMGAAL